MVGGLGSDPVGIKNAKFAGFSERFAASVHTCLGYRFRAFAVDSVRSCYRRPGRLSTWFEQVQHRVAIRLLLLLLLPRPPEGVNGKMTGAPNPYY